MGGFNWEELVVGPTEETFPFPVFLLLSLPFKYPWPFDKFPKKKNKREKAH